MFIPLRATQGAADRYTESEGDLNHWPSIDISSCMEALATPSAARAEMAMIGDPQPSERALIGRAKAGDVAAFERLYRTTVGRVYALCLRMTGDPHLAEELTQESYLIAWQKLAGFRGDSAFSTWLHRVAVNLVLSDRRRQSRRDEQSSGEPEASRAGAAAATRSPATTLDLERAIAGLPERARTVFVLHDVEGYRHREISELAGMAVGTSKAQLSRARGLLRKALTS
jgi:RNA polymerase sigma-70 factor (ECF subfamily)